MLNHIRQFKLLQILIVLAVVAFSFRLVDVVTGVSGIVSIAMAESEAAAEEGADMKEDMAASEETDSEDKDVKMAEAASEEVVIADDAPESKWRDASDSDMQGEVVKMELMENMVERRQAMDAREKGLMTREALLRAAEQELDRKHQELSQLKTEIEKLLETQSEEETGRIKSLVKVYESMKAKDAARIFDTLDLDVLVSVMSQMSERRMSPILAAMNAERARTITIMLAEQKQLPELPQN